jgi:effector-binding domain-containing protein
MDYQIELADIEAQSTAVVAGQVAHDGIGAFLGAALGQVMSALGPIPVTGPPFARYDMTDDGWDIESGFPIAHAFAGSGDVVGSSLPAGQVARTVHEGSYLQLGGAYVALEKWIAEQGMAPTGSPWEVYLNDPHEETPRTLVVWPCATA